MKHQYAEIPIPEEDLERFKKLADNQGCKVEVKKKELPYVRVYFDNPISLYWLGANFAIPHFVNGLTMHE